MTAFKGEPSRVKENPRRYPAGACPCRLVVYVRTALGAGGEVVTLAVVDRLLALVTVQPEVVGVATRALRRGVRH